MQALDTNILVYLHRSDMVEHDHVRDAFRSSVEQGETIAIVLPTVHEFLAVVTNSRIFKDTTPIDKATGFIAGLIGHSNIRLVSEQPGHIQALRTIVGASGATGRGIYDARIATICLEHGVHTIWTRDRDFSRFRELKTFNPLAAI